MCSPPRATISARPATPTIGPDAPGASDRRVGGKSAISGRPAGSEGLCAWTFESFVGLPFTRSTAHCATRATCTSSTSESTESARHAAVSPHVIPQAIPRRAAPASRLLGGRLDRQAAARSRLLPRSPAAATYRWTRGIREHRRRPGPQHGLVHGRQRKPEDRRQPRVIRHLCRVAGSIRYGLVPTWADPRKSPVSQCPAPHREPSSASWLLLVLSPTGGAHTPSRGSGSTAAVRSNSRRTFQWRKRSERTERHQYRRSARGAPRR